MRERRVLLSVVGVLILLGVLSFGVGWVAHALYSVFGSSGSTPETMATATPDVGGQESLSPTPSPTLEAAVRTTPQMTSTPRPTPIELPLDLLFEVIESDVGLYDVCRRFCRGRWPDDDVPKELHDYAREVAAQNNIDWQDGSPIIQAGRNLQMLKCPED